MSIDYFLILLAVLALLGVVFEEHIHVNKAKTTLFFGTLSWVILFITAGDAGPVEHGLSENLTEIATLWLFLLSAMTFVAYLNKKGMIENLIYIFLPRRITERRLMFLTAIFCFVFSSLADNITATLCSIALILSLQLDARKTVKFAVMVVFAVNSGGVALITGDVTTLMIFLADKVAIEDLILLSLPAFLAVMLLAALLCRGLDGEVVIEPHSNELRTVDLTIAAIFLATIIGTIVANILFEIPPVLSFLFGLSLMFLAARFFNEDLDDDPILDYIRMIEFETLMFFLGVLLVVGMLREIHILDSVADLYTAMPDALASYTMGALSAVIDNVPLTAALLKSGIEMPTAEWLVLAYGVGVGGSLLVIGSAAGIVAMSKVPELSFQSYMRYLVPLGIAYTCGFGGAYVLGQVIF